MGVPIKDPPGEWLPCGFRSGRNTNVFGQLHTGFKLSSSPSFLALLDPTTNIVSSFAPTYPQQFTDVSYGRDRTDPTVLGYFTNSTPGAANASRGAGFSGEVFFSRAGGTFQGTFSLSLSTDDPNSDIRYLVVTSNVPSGSPAITNVPTSTSTLYTGPLSSGAPPRSEPERFRGKVLCFLVPSIPNVISTLPRLRLRLLPIYPSF